MRKTPSLTLIESDPENMKRVQRISMQYESINVTPTSPVPQRRSPREPKKIDLPLETNTLMDELHSKLRSRQEKAANKLSTIDSKDSKDSKDSFFEAEFSVFPEVQPEMLVRGNLEQIKLFSEFAILKEDERSHFRSLLNRLGKSIAGFEETYKKRFMDMKMAQDSSFAEISIEKNEELIKLRSEVKNLNKLKEAACSQLQSELNAAKDEVQRLNSIVQKQKDEINKLTYSLADAQSYIESLERAKQIAQTFERTASSEQHMQLANEHFKTIKQALLANRNLLKVIQRKNSNHSD